MAAFLAAMFLMTASLAGCGKNVSSESSAPEAAAPSEETAQVESGASVPEEGSPEEEAPSAEPLVIPDDPYRTTYEIFVYSFADGNGDGVGDLPGIREKIGYFGPDEGGLGCTSLWTTPIFPSPTYHKYDVSDYCAIDPEFGTMEDFEALLADLHDRGMTWILDLPLNHTSTEHPWFREAARYLASLPEGAEPVYEDCPYVWYYRFSEEKYEGYEPLSASGLYDGARPWFYEARFWSGMPDLNLDTEAVREEITKILRFWIDKGIDGFRLDAVTSYYSGDKNANVGFLSWLRNTAQEMKPDIYFVGEAWENQQIYAEYYESGIDSLFDFAFSGAEGMIAKTVNGKKTAEAFAQALSDEEALYAGYNAEFVNAPFYTNHDMARGAGYYPNDDGSRTKLALGLNFMMTGNAYLYYGEELGMKGSGRDENKRAPMQWTADAGAPGMCKGPQDMEKFNMKFPPADTQADDPASVLNYVKNAVSYRNRYPAIARGKTAVVTELTGDTVCAFTRYVEGGAYPPVLIVINTGKEDAQLAIAGEAASFADLAGTLCAGAEEASLTEGMLTLPPYGIAILAE
ncbi:MAG: alpha-amylase [Lachnospiraceae bacterium]|nr:alpha-amylase [Lachnospiraceae bacterium]MBQ6546153.1 alpha-amylase [Lachnospiraceae bacterium]